MKREERQAHRRPETMGSTLGRTAQGAESPGCRSTVDGRARAVREQEAAGHGEHEGRGEDGERDKSNDFTRDVSKMSRARRVFLLVSNSFPTRRVLSPTTTAPPPRSPLAAARSPFSLALLSIGRN